MMKMMKKALIATALLACTAGVFAAPANEAKPHSGPQNVPVMMPPPPPAPVYSVTQQTDAPNDALNNAVKNVPVLEKGKKYEIRVEVKELPPAPERAPAPQQ